MKKKYNISTKIKGHTYLYIDSLDELIEMLENIGIISIDIQNYPPYDDSPNTINSNLSIYDISNDIFDNLAKSEKYIPFISPRDTSPYPVVKKENMIDETYLPFKGFQIKKYFSKSKDKHLKYYTDSAEKYRTWEKDKPNIEQAKYKSLRQIEKDERFWLAKTFISIFEQLNKKRVVEDIEKILIKAFGETPPLKSFKTWKQALSLSDNEELILRFEENIPSSPLFKGFLSKNLNKRHIIPYVLESGENKKMKDSKYRKDLEGPTNVDALIINPSNGFNIFIEAKVLSDISYQVSYDIFRNQIARNIDVMTTKQDTDDVIRKKMDETKSLFVLLTPEVFKNNKQTRFYWYKMNDYTNNPLTLMADLNHRTDIERYQWENISKRIGWVTWEEIK